MFSLVFMLALTSMYLQVPIPQNGKTHSNNLLAICQQIIGMFFTILWDWRLKGCIIFVTAVITFDWQYPSANVLLRNSCLGNLRSSRLQFFKIGVLNYSTNFTGNTSVAGLQYH